MRLLFLCFIASLFTCNALISMERRAHRPKQLLDPQVRTLATISNTTHIDVILDNILVPRVVGTKNHKRVRKYIIKELEKIGWTIEIDEFDDVTPTFGKLTFSNIIASLNPNADRFLVLACHYDSKYTRENNFVGAIDSAVPCAMMINLAVQMQTYLNTIKSDNKLSLRFIFFDGEEAFKQWSDSDSLYGARHLAEKWSSTNFISSNNERTNELDRLDVIVLLDLLGTPDPKFYSYFGESEKWYVRLAQAEERLADMGQLKQYSRGQPQQTYFAQRSVRANIQDDHVPFMQRGVPILHLIQSPFPDVWHTPEDNRFAIDMHTVENLNKILRVFVAEYMHLSI